MRGPARRRRPRTVGAVAGDRAVSRRSSTCPTSTATRAPAGRPAETCPTDALRGGGRPTSPGCPIAWPRRLARAAGLPPAGPTVLMPILTDGRFRPKCDPTSPPGRDSRAIGRRRSSSWLCPGPDGSAAVILTERATYDGDPQRRGLVPGRQGRAGRRRPRGDRPARGRRGDRPRPGGRGRRVGRPTRRHCGFRSAASASPRSSRLPTARRSSGLRPPRSPGSSRRPWPHSCRVRRSRSSSGPFATGRSATAATGSTTSTSGVPRPGSSASSAR